MLLVLLASCTPPENGDDGNTNVNGESGMTDSEKQVERDRLAEELELWLLEYGLTGEVA